MYCGNCGTPLNNGICPRCSSMNNMQVNNQNNLMISRPGTFMGFAVKLDVTVNGQLVKLGAGDTFYFAVPFGPCVVKYKFWCRREKEVFINVQPNRGYSVIFKYDALWGGFKISDESILN